MFPWPAGVPGGGYPGYCPSPPRAPNLFYPTMMGNGQQPFELPHSYQETSGLSVYEPPPSSFLRPYGESYQPVAPNYADYQQPIMMQGAYDLRQANFEHQRMMHEEGRRRAQMSATKCYLLVPVVSAPPMNFIPTAPPPPPRNPGLNSYYSRRVSLNRQRQQVMPEPLGGSKVNAAADYPIAFYHTDYIYDRLSKPSPMETIVLDDDLPEKQIKRAIDDTCSTVTASLPTPVMTMKTTADNNVEKKPADQGEAVCPLEDNREESTPFEMDSTRSSISEENLKPVESSAVEDTPSSDFMPPADCKEEGELTDSDEEMESPGSVVLKGDPKGTEGGNHEPSSTVESTMSADVGEEVNLLDSHEEMDCTGSIIWENYKRSRQPSVAGSVSSAEPPKPKRFVPPFDRLVEKNVPRSKWRQYCHHCLAHNILLIHGPERSCFMKHCQCRLKKRSIVELIAIYDNYKKEQMLEGDEQKEGSLAEIEASNLKTDKKEESMEQGKKKKNKKKRRDRQPVFEEEEAQKVPETTNDLATLATLADVAAASEDPMMQFEGWPPSRCCPKCRVHGFIFKEHAWRTAVRCMFADCACDKCWSIERKRERSTVKYEKKKKNREEMKATAVAEEIKQRLARRRESLSTCPVRRSSKQRNTNNK